MLWGGPRSNQPRAPTWRVRPRPGLVVFGRIESLRASDLSAHEHASISTRSSREEQRGDEEQDEQEEEQEEEVAGGGG